MNAVIAAAAWAIAVAVGGGLLTDIGPWYYGLKKPSFQPPDWLFGPVWTTLFVLGAIAAVLAWRGARDAGQRRALVIAYVVNGILNVGWSGLFFRLHRPDLAFYELIALWLSILVLILVARRSSGWAAILLVPYLAWVTFAGVLNRAVVTLNAPF